MYSQRTHPGNMPIRILRINIETKFSNIRDEVQKMHLNSPEIISNIYYDCNKKSIYDCVKNKLITSYAQANSSSIYLSESYMSHLWCVCYYFFVIQEYIIFRQKQNDWDGCIDYNIPILKRAKNLFNWGISLRDSYSSWDLSLPNPDFDNCDINACEKDFMGKTNNIFTTAVTYVLFHEYAHLSNEHFREYNELWNKTSLSPKEQDDIIQMEKEADNFAFDTIVKYYDDDVYTQIKGVSMVLVHIANMFLLKNIRCLIQKNHPDIDQRLLNIIEKINLSDKSKKEYLQNILALGIRMFFNNNGFRLCQKTYTSIDEMIRDYIYYIDKIKNEELC
jgi:hypothetical protein